MKTPKIVDDFCKWTPQASVNSYVELIDAGEMARAFKLIKQNEGTFFTDEQILEIIDYIYDTATGVLWRYTLDCGRHGVVEGVFVAREKDIDAVIGSSVYFGEILGKHSEVSGELEKSEFKLLTRDKSFIRQAKQYGLVPSGYNPLEYVMGYCEKHKSEYRHGEECEECRLERETEYCEKHNVSYAPDEKCWRCDNEEWEAKNKK